MNINNKGILKLRLFTTENLQWISVIKHLLADCFVPVFYLLGILFFISYIFLNILLLQINLIKLLEKEHLILSTVSATIASAKIPFNKE